MKAISETTIVVNDIQQRIAAEVEALRSVGFAPDRIIPSYASVEPRVNFAAFFISMRTPQNVYAACNGIVTGWPETDMQQKTILEAFILGICDLNPKFPFIIFTEDTYPGSLYRSRRNILVMEPYAIGTTGIRMRDMFRTLSS